MEFKDLTLSFMEPLFKILDKTEGVEQMDEHHPEGDVLTHSLQVYGWAIRETDDVDLILAALLHDTGKAINSPGHAKLMTDILKPLVSAKTLWLIENHMRVWHYILGEMKKLKKCQELAGHPWLPELVQLARFDKLGRNPNKKVVYDKEKILFDIGMKMTDRFIKNKERANREGTTNA